MSTLNAAATAPSLRKIAIAGNPNCGKTTLFNALTGLRQKVGNYPGVTVEHKTGRCFGPHGETFHILDLPGSYSLQVRSPDEAVARDALLGRIEGEARPDAVVAVVDASNLVRNLYLVVQLLDLQIPLIVALNMMDVAEANGCRVDVAALEEALGVPVIPMVASKGAGLVELKHAMARTPLPAPQFRAPVPEAVRREAELLAAKLPGGTKDGFAEALLLLTLGGQALDDLSRLDPAAASAAAAGQETLRAAGVEPVSALVEARYEWIGGICAKAVRRPDGPASLSVSDKMDIVLTHRVWGWFAFLGAMALMFFCIFSVAQIPMEWIDSGTGALSEWVTSHMADGDLRSLIVDGVIAGVGGVVIFLPQILVLFFFLGLLEDSGYMARAAFMMDRVMASVGLHGKSFIPLLSSFACAIPGIMAARTVENRKDRLVTILVAPLMSCSARLPVYAIMIAVMMPAATSWAKAGIMLSMYLVGVVAAFTMAWLFKKTLLKSETPMLLLELPPYRMPSMRSIALRMLERGGIFLRRAGTVIFAFSIILWALAAYPKPENPESTGSEAIAQSYAGRMGHFIEPVIRPLGYDWKIGVGLIGSFAAREVFVGTLAIVYSIEDDVEEDNTTMLEAMHAETRADGTPVFTPLVCVGLMVFYVLAMQCLSTTAVVRRETNSWRWPLFQIAYMTTLAWLGAFVVYQGGKLLGFQ